MQRHQNPRPTSPMRIVVSILGIVALPVLLALFLIAAPASATTVVGGGTYEDNNPAVTYENTWTQYADANASGSTYTFSSVTYAIAKIYVTGAKSFQVKSITGPNRGIVKVLIDGNDIAHVDAYSASVQYGALSAIYNLPDTNQHWIGIQVSGSKNALSSGYIAVLDQFIVNGAAAPTGAPTATSTPTTSTAGTTYEDNNSGVSYQNTWTRTTDSSASGGTYTRTNIMYAIASLTVSGIKSFQFQTITGPDRSIYKVLIDGKDAAHFDAYSPATQYGVISPVYNLPDTNQHWIGIQAGDIKNASSSGYAAILDKFVVYSSTFSQPTATSTPAPTGTPMPTNTPAPTGHVRRVNAPNFGANGISLNQAGIFWLGQVTPNTQYGDVRVGYNNSELLINANVIDAYLWYNANSPAPSNLTQYDGVTLLLSKNGTGISLPDSSSYRFDAQMTWWETNRTKWQAGYQGNGSGWTLTSIPFTTVSNWRGNQPNDTVLDQGFNITYHIPFSSLGLSGPPATGATWGLGIALHNRNDAAGTPIADRVWPENMGSINPSTWGHLRFGLAPGYSAPSTSTSQTVMIRNNLNGQVATTTNVGGYTLCGTNIVNSGLAYYQQWGLQNWVGKEYLNVMNQTDIADWACYNKVYAMFPLASIPAGEIIKSATLTLYQYGSAGASGQTPGPSLIQLFSTDTGWTPSTINVNNAPLPNENLDRQWAGTGSCPNFVGCPSVTFDVSQMVADAYKAGHPLWLVIYDADEQISSGKYFFASEQGDWNAVNRPALKVTFGNP